MEVAIKQARYSCLRPYEVYLFPHRHLLSSDWAWTAVSRIAFAQGMLWLPGKAEEPKEPISSTNDRWRCLKNSEVGVGDNAAMGIASGNAPGTEDCSPYSSHVVRAFEYLCHPC